MARTPTSIKGTPIPRQAEAAMLLANIPYHIEWAARLVGGCVAFGALVGLIVTVIRAVVRG